MTFILLDWSNYCDFVDQLNIHFGNSKEIEMHKDVVSVIVITNSKLIDELITEKNLTQVQVDYTQAILRCMALKCTNFPL